MISAYPGQLKKPLLLVAPCPASAAGREETLRQLYPRENAISDFPPSSGLPRAAPHPRWIAVPGRHRSREAFSSAAWQGLRKQQSCCSAGTAFVCPQRGFIQKAQSRVKKVGLTHGSAGGYKSWAHSSPVWANSPSHCLVRVLLRPRWPAGGNFSRNTSCNTSKRLCPLVLEFGVLQRLSL